MPGDVLDVHDRVIDEHAECEDQGEERDTVDRVAGDKVDREREPEDNRHRDGDDERLLPAHRHGEQRHHNHECDDNRLDQLVDFLVGHQPRVAGDDQLEIGGQHIADQLLGPADHVGRHGDGVAAALLGDRDHDHWQACVAGGVDGRRFGLGMAVRLLTADHRARAAVMMMSGAMGRAPAMPHEVGGLRGAVFDGGDVGQPHGPAVRHADDDLREVPGRRQRVAGFDRHGAVVADEPPRWQDRVRGGDRPRHRHEIDAIGGHSLDRGLDPHDPPLAADDRRPRYLGHHRQPLHQFLRYPPQLVGIRGARPRRDGERHHRHVVDLHRPHHPAGYAGRDPVGMLSERGEELHQAPLAILPDVESHRDDRLVGLRHAVDVFHAIDLVEDPLQRCGHQLLDLGGGVAGEAHEHVGQRHDDLRILFPRRDQERRGAGGQRHDDQDDREVRVEKQSHEPRERIGVPRFLGVVGCLGMGVSRHRAISSAAVVVPRPIMTRSPARSPESTSRSPSIARPRRMARRSMRPSATRSTIANWPTRRMARSGRTSSDSSSSGTLILPNMPLVTPGGHGPVTFTWKVRVAACDSGTISRTVAWHSMPRLSSRAGTSWQGTMRPRSISC